ncbi:HAD family hydrolase [Micromonospora sp. MS34]|uniref:HAD family hydrolase n=1 Tax=Micromonospora sp. MS34 TaxID=3385971 RepID=UPI0039A1E237
MFHSDLPTMVVFDVDDTLYLERDYVASGFEHAGQVARQRWGVRGLTGAAWGLFESGCRGDVFDRALTALGVTPTPERIAVLVRAYRTHRPRITLLPDVRPVLEELWGRGVAIGVLTDGPPESQAAKVLALRLRRYARHTVLTDRYGPGYGKPHPRGFQELADGCGTGRIAYVADNPHKDFIAPRQLGWVTVRVRRPGGQHVAVPHGDDVDHVLTDFSGLTEALADRRVPA